MREAESVVFVVDDDSSVREAIKSLIGSLAAIDVQVTGPVSESWSNLFAIAHRVRRRLEPMPEVKQAIIQQVGNYPTLQINVDRVRAARLGVSEVDVVNNLITAINNNALIAKNIWIDPSFGEDYYLSAQYYEAHRLARHPAGHPGWHATPGRGSNRYG